MNPDSTPTSDATKNTAQPKAISVLRITLATLFIVACAVAGFDYQAKVKWQKAVKVANKLFDEGNDDPKKYMDQIGSSPRATVSGGELTQIYRWTGGLRTYDLRLKFHGAKGIYVLSELLPITQFTFKTSDISKMERAKATGTLDDKSTEDSFVMTIQDGADGFGTGGRPDGGAGGRPDGGAGGRPGGGAGGRPGGGAGGGFRGFNGSDLNMDKDTQAKWDSAVKKISEYMTDLPEDRRVAFTKRRELQQKFREEAKGYLSEEQYAIFEKNNPVRQSRGRGGINAEQLGLEGDVKTKYEAATEKLNEQRRALFAGGGERSREGLLEKMMAMRDKHKAELKTILSADQFKKYQGIESQQRQRRGGFRRPGGGGSRPQSPKGSNPKATKSGTKDN